MTLLANVSAALSLVFRNMLETQINSVTVIPFLLPVLMGSGKSLNWTAEFGEAANAVPTAEGVALSSSDADDELERELTQAWSQFTKVSSVTDLAQSATATNLNPMSIGTLDGNLLAGRVMKQGRRMALGVATQVYSGDGTVSGNTVQLVGADTAIASSGTVGGLSSATESDWVSTQETGPLTGITLQQIREFFTAVFEACGFYPEWCTCDATIFDAIRGLYNDFEANVTREVRMVRGGGEDGELPRVQTLEAGMRAVMVDQIPIILDLQATSNTLFAWNSQFVEIRQLPFAPVRRIMMGGAPSIVNLFRRVSKNRELVLPRRAVEGMMRQSPGITPFVKMLGDRGMSTEAVVGWFGQMCWKRRNGLGKFVYT